jgi:tetratricopeptide (TPR) repeat protein
MSIRGRRLVVLGAVLLLTGCAGRAAVPPATAPAAARYPDFVYPAVPPALQGAPGAERIDIAWRFLQSGDTRNAARDFEAALKRNPQFYPARAGEGYVALARGDHERALAGFDAALRLARDYVPGLVGRGQTLLAMKRDADAVAAFEAALAVDGSLENVRRRVDLLRFRIVEEVIEAARSDASAGRLDRARAAYERAVALSPDSSFLYRELAAVERRQGDNDLAARHFARAIELDPSDSAALAAMADLLVERQEYQAADEAYRKAAEIDPSPELTAKMAALAARVRESNFPAEFRAIPDAATVSRGELAALIGVRLERFLAAAPQQQVVITDASGHWAGAWIAQVARAGVMDPFENHTFQPALVIRRGDLATAVRRVLTMAAAANAGLRKRLTEQPAIADMPATHLVYPAAAAAVVSGVMPLADGARFEVNRPVTGAEAVDAINRLQALVR